VAKLIINPTSSNRREIVLSRSTLLAIGRDPSNDLVLPDAMVSRRHAVVEWRGSQFFVRDCNSSNGSVVNGDRISEKLLRDGDLLAIGTARLLFRDDLAEPGAKVVPHPSSPKMQCPACQAEYRKGDLFCRECGEKLASASGPPKIICASCGTAVTHPARFCSACGAPFARGDESTDEEGSDGSAAGGPSRSPAGIPASAAAPVAEAAPPASPLPLLVSDEPPTGPPAPAPFREKPMDARPAGSAMAASALPVSPLPLSPLPVVVSEPARVPAGLPEARGADRARPDSGQRSARSGDRLRPVRTGEASGGAARSPAAVRPPAPFGVRLLAGLADALVVGAAQALILAPVLYYWSGREAPQPSLGASLLPIVLSLTLLPLAAALGVAYYVYSWGTRGATPGQSFFELTVESEDGQRPIGLGRAGLRFVGYLLSLASLGVGFLMIALTGSGLHDRIAGTRVVRSHSA
jgi:uncharacterized RDD family membrane protein YckC